MWFVVLGVIFIGMKLGDVGFVAPWAWWWVLSPFALAVVWWAWSDSIGLTKKHEMDKMEARKAERRRKNLENLGLYDPSRKGQKKEADVRHRVAEKIMQGSSGVWGQVPMPANPQVNAAEAKQLATWVLSQK